MLQMISYKDVNIEHVNAILLDRIKEKNILYAVEYNQIRKILSCLIGWLVVDVVYIDYVSYMIVKRIM